jgi:hypothetical protein
MKVKAAAEGKSITSDGEGAIDFEDGESTMTITAGGRAVEQRVVDQVLYQKVPGQQQDGKPWMKIDLSKVARQQGADPGQIGDPARSAAYAKAPGRSATRPGPPPTPRRSATTTSPGPVPRR